MTRVRYSNRTNDFFANQLMNQLFKETGRDFTNSKQNDQLKTNILETKDGYSIQMAIPGFSKEEVCIHVENGMLLVKAIKESKIKEDKEGDYKYLQKEFESFDAERKFKLSEKIEDEKITAEVKDGILSIYLPKREEEKPKKLNIEVQ